MSIIFIEANSQESDSIAFLGLDTVINISANRQESRPSFHLIDKSMLELNDGISTQTVLNQVPGVFMHSGTLSTNRITIRGVGNRSPFATSKIRAYFNDIPLTSGIGETSLEDIDMGLIDEIEIWKGPTASRYGAGLGGMIHYKTSSRTPGLDITSKIGSFGLIRTSENIVFNNKDESMQIRINHNYTRRDGWRDNSDYNRKGIALQLENTGSKSILNFIVHHIDLFGQIPSSLNKNDFENEPQKAAFTWNQVNGFENYKKTLSGISYSSIWPDIWQLKASLSYFGRKGNESRPFNILEDENMNLNGRVVLAREVNKSKLKVGVEVFRENYNWATFETNLGTKGTSLDSFNELRKYINIFSELRIEINPKWAFEAGANLNKTNYFLNDPPPQIPNDFVFDWNLSPNVNIVFIPSQNKNFYFTTSHGFATPTLEETLTPEGSVNPSIGPETGWNFEIGARGFNQSGKLSYDFSLYRMHLRNLLVTRTYPDLNTGFDQVISENAGKTVHQGVDAFIKYQLINSSNSKLSVSATYTFQDYFFKDFVNDQDDYSHNQLTGTIPHRLFGMLLFNYRKFHLTTQYQFVDALPMRDDNSEFSDPYHLVHMKALYRIVVNDRFQIETSIGVNNLLDKSYASMILINAGSFGGNLPRYYYPGNPRNWYGGLNFKYSF